MIVCVYRGNLIKNLDSHEANNAAFFRICLLKQVLSHSKPTSYKPNLTMS